MTSIEPFGSPALSQLESLSPAGRLARQTRAALAGIDAGRSVSLVRVEAAAEIQAAKVSAVAYVGRQAMQDVALLSQIESQLVQAVPHASGRLASIADLTAIAMTEVVVDTARRIGR